MGENLPPILFRLDFSPKIGAGHAVRCGALAEMLCDHGVQTRLVTTSNCESHNDWRCAGFSRVICIAPGSCGFTLPARDAELTLKQARIAGSRCVVVDHYGANAGYFARIKAGGLKLAVIDDVGGRDFHAADWLLNQNIGAKRIPYNLQSRCRKLLGPKFALLRIQFAARIQNPSTKSREPLRVLVTMGGGDTAKLSARVLKAIAKVEPPIQVRCIANGSPKDWASLNRTANSYRHSNE
jgi:UDP-2,4-diacetamido-2,4,6-trideoxy-beta-L-altropyranose hydrolase